MVQGGALKMHCVSTRGFEPHSQHIRVAQWKRSGLITQRSLDRNQALITHFAPIAQLVERTAVNREVSGSNPLGSVFSCKYNQCIFLDMYRYDQRKLYN